MRRHLVGQEHLALRRALLVHTLDDAFDPVLDLPARQLLRGGAVEQAVAEVGGIQAAACPRGKDGQRSAAAVAEAGGDGRKVGRQFVEQERAQLEVAQPGLVFASPPRSRRVETPASICSSTTRVSGSRSAKYR